MKIKYCNSLNMKIKILFLLFLIILLNIVVNYFKLKEGYTNGSVKVQANSGKDVHVNQIGEFKDSGSRRLPKYYGRPVGIDKAIETCAEYAYNDGYTFFGLQHPQGGNGKPQCFASNDYSHAISLGTKNNHVGTVNKYKRVRRIVRRRKRKRCYKWRRGKLRKRWCYRWVRKVTRKSVLTNSFVINSDDYGTGWGNTVYELDKSDIIYDDANENIGIIQGKRNYTGSWDIVFDKLDDGSIHEEEDWLPLLTANRGTGNETLDNNGNRHYGIIWRSCENCVGQFKDIFYKRLTPWKQTNDNKIKDLFNKQWKTTNNVFNTDYKLYSSYSDALNDENPWKYCSSSDSPDGEGFPGTCGPETEVTGQSRSTTSDSETDWTYAIEVVDEPNMNYESTNN
jgi:hypothetical protein